jgi:Tfp pilus assembly protein PilO
VVFLSADDVQEFKNTMSLKETKVQIFILVLLVLCVGIYFWYTGIYRPILAQKREKSEELQRLRTSLETAKQQAARRVSLQQEFDQLQEQWKVVETLLPRERNMSDFIQDLHRIKGKVDATVERVSPMPSSTVDFYTENPYEVEMLTTYHGLGQFFSHVANLPIIVDVSDLDITALPSEGESEDEETEILRPTISSRFVLTTYSLSQRITPGQEEDR